MSIFDFLRLPLAIAVVLLAIGCEEPRQRSPDPVSPPERTPEPAPPQEAESSEEGAGEEPDAAPDAARAADEEKSPAEPTEREQPEISVTKEDGVIVIEGALKSRLQMERIGSELAEAFPDLEVENRLREEEDRYPVGWGNRVTEAFLIPYFRHIEEPTVSYREGIITLEGKGDERDFRRFGKLAVPAFAGTFSRDIDNRIGKGD